MKKVIIYLAILSLIFSSYRVNAQTKDQELSNAERFSDKSGSLMQKEFYTIGELKSTKIEVVHYTDLLNNQKQNAVKLEYESYKTGTKVAVLDADEVDALIKSIQIIQEKIFATVPANYTEVSFKSRGGFEAGCYWSKDNWATYLKLEEYDSDSYVFLKKDDFPVLLELLNQVKLKL